MENGVIYGTQYVECNGKVIADGRLVDPIMW